MTVIWLIFAVTTVLPMGQDRTNETAQARLRAALSAPVLERRQILIELDSDRVDLETRTAALYYLGAETSDAELLARCVRLAPKGRYAESANLKYCMILGASADAAVRRKGLEVLLGLAFGGGKMADEAMYLAAIVSYREKRYDEAGSLFRRYCRKFPKGEHLDDARSMSAWCHFLQGCYAEAAEVCEEGESDDLAYIRAACAYSTGDSGKALTLFRKYLKDYPDGQYRADAELPIARIEFDAALKTNDVQKTVDRAKRGFEISKLAGDQLRLAWAYEKAGRMDEARAEYIALARAFPDSGEAVEALYRQAMVEARGENWSAVETALAEAQASGKLGKRLAEALYWRGVAAMRLGHEVEGSGFLENAVAAGLGADEAREARLMVADFDYRSGRLEQAKAAYRKLVEEGACRRMSEERIQAIGNLLGGPLAEEVCAQALVKSESPEWRQAGWELKGRCEESRQAFTEAIDSYRRCLAEPAKTAARASASLQLGKLEFEAGEFERANRTLSQAVDLNGGNAHARAEAYVMLAKNAEAKGDAESAVAYATVVLSLFGEEAFQSEARRIVVAHPKAR